MEGIDSHLEAKRFALSPQLSVKEARVYLFLVKKLGRSRVPRSVPLLHIAKAVELSYKQVRLVMTKLIKYGLIEKWTETHQGKGGHNTFLKTSYYRLK